MGGFKSHEERGGGQRRFDICHKKVGFFLKGSLMQGRVFSMKLSPNLRMRTKREENALQEENLKLFHQLNLYKIQKILSNIVKLPDFVAAPIIPKS